MSRVSREAQAWYDGFAVMTKPGKGRGPGHWGHAGRPGKRGGSLPGPGHFTGGLAAALTRDGVEHEVSGHDVEMFGTSKQMDKFLTKLGFSPTSARPKGAKGAASEYTHTDGRVNVDVKDTDKGVKASFWQ